MSDFPKAERPALPPPGQSPDSVPGLGPDKPFTRPGSVPTEPAYEQPHVEFVRREPTPGPVVAPVVPMPPTRTESAPLVPPPTPPTGIEQRETATGAEEAGQPMSASRSNDPGPTESAGQPPAEPEQPRNTGAAPEEAPATPGHGTPFLPGVSVERPDTDASAAPAADPPPPEQALEQPYQSLIERARDAGAWPRMPEGLETQAPPPVLGDVLSRLDSNLARVVGHDPEQGPPPSDALVVCATESVRAVSAVIDHVAKHADDATALELITAAKDMAVATYAQDMSQAQQHLQQLRQAISQTDPELLNTLTRRFDDTMSWLSVNPERTQATTQVITDHLNGEPALLVPIANGGLMAGLEVHALYTGGNTDSGTELYPVRLSLHKQGDTLPRLTERELDHIRGLARDRPVVIIDDVSTEYLGDTLSRAADYFSDVLGKSVLAVASLRAIPGPAVRVWDHQELAEPGASVHFSDIEATVTQHQGVEYGSAVRAAERFKGYLQLFVAKSGRQLDTNDHTEWSESHTSTDSSGKEMNISVGSRPMPSNRVLRGTPFADFTVKEEVEYAGQPSTRETKLSFIDFGYQLFGQRSIRYIDRESNLVEEIPGPYVKCNESVVEAIRRAIYRRQSPPPAGQ